MAGKITYKFKDHSGESSYFNLTTDDITGANYDSVDTLNGALLTALGGVTVGRVANETFLGEATDNGQAAASNPLAMRELKWRLTLVDSVTGETLYRELPTPDVTLVVANTDMADMADAAWVSLKSAIDGNYNNPETGNSLLLTGAQIVGRNL